MDDKIFYHATPSSRVEAILRDGLFGRRTPPNSQWHCSGVYASKSIRSAHRWAKEIVCMIGHSQEMTILSFTHPGGFSRSSFGRGIAEQVWFREDVPAGLIHVVETIFVEADDEPVFSGKKWA